MSKLDEDRQTGINFCIPTNPVDQTIIKCLPLEREVRRSSSAQVKSGQVSCHWSRPVMESRIQYSYSSTGFWVLEWDSQYSYARRSEVQEYFASTKFNLL